MDQPDDIDRLLNVLFAVCDSVDTMTDDEIRDELAALAEPGPSVGEIIEAALARARESGGQK